MEFRSIMDIQSERSIIVALPYHVIDTMLDGSIHLKGVNGDMEYGFIIIGSLEVSTMTILAWEHSEIILRL